MPLDPEVKAVLDALTASGDPPMEEVPIAEARRGDWARPFIGEPEPVRSVEHRFIPGPTADLPVRIYTPDGVGPFPAVVYFHGSAWCVSNIEQADVAHRALTNRTGCVVVAVNYQKSPEHRFPVPFQDAFAATAWVAENAVELGLDPDAIGVGGDSAGGNLAAAACLRARDEGGPRIRFQVLVYPAVDARMEHRSIEENAEGFLLTAATLRWAWQQYLRSPTDADEPYASPLRADDLSGLPPAIVVTAELDPLRDEGEEYAARLAEAGVPVVVRRYDGVVHGFFWMLGAVSAARQMLDDVARDLKELLAQAPASLADNGEDV